MSSLVSGSLDVAYRSRKIEAWAVFQREVGKETPVQVVITYPESVRNCENFGQMEGDFSTWHYLDQIAITAGHLGEQTQVLFVPYGDCLFESSTYLAAGRWEGASGIFYNGTLVDFKGRFRPEFDHEKWQNPQAPSYEASYLETARTHSKLENDWWYLAAGPGGIVTKSIESSIVDEELFGRLMDSETGMTETEGDALVELATVNYEVTSSRTEYVAEASGKRYRVSVEHRSATRLDTLQVSPTGAVDAEAGMSFTVLAVTLSHQDQDSGKVYATTHYSVKNFDTNDKRLDRVDYTYRGGSTPPDGETSSFIPGLSEVIDFSHKMVPFEKPPYVASSESCTVYTDTYRYNDVNNLSSLIPRLRPAYTIDH